MFADGVADTTIDESPAPWATCSSSPDRRLPIPATAQRLGDVQERELRDRGPQMRHDDADPDQPSVHEGAERHPTRVDVVLEFVPLCFDGVFAVPVCVPGRRAPGPGPLHQLRPTLFVEEIDVLSPIDLADERELRASQPPYLDAFLHRATIAHRSSRLVAASALRHVAHQIVVCARTKCRALWGHLISRCFGHVPIGQEIQGLYQDHLCERHLGSSQRRVPCQKERPQGFCSASGTRHCNPISRISSVMLRFAHPAMVQKNAEAFTVAYPWAKPPAVGWASADPSRLGRLFSGGTTTQLGIARIDRLSLSRRPIRRSCSGRPQSRRSPPAPARSRPDRARGGQLRLCGSS